MNCINLKQLCGKRYRVIHDPAAELEPNGNNDPWLFILKGRGGEIYPYGGAILAVLILGNKRANRAKRLNPTWQLHQDSDGETIYLFSPKDLDAAATIIKARKKRILSDQHRETLVKAGRRYQYKPQNNGA